MMEREHDTANGSVDLEAIGFRFDAQSLQRDLVDSLSTDVLQRFDGLRVLDEVARGGQGIVYRAVDLSDGSVCAVKCVLSGAAATPVELARQAREGELLRALAHPNIITVRSVRAGDYGAVIVTDWVEGESVLGWCRETLRECGMEPVLRAFRKIADALSHAHARGVVHRDLKPSNILVREDGEPVVLDFGAAGVAGSLSSAPACRPVTVTGVFVGTYAYASPEQVIGRSDEVDARSDIFSFGVLLRECLLDGESGEDTPDAVGREGQRRREALRRIVHRCTMRYAGDRYARMEDVERDLARAERGRMPVARLTRRNAVPYAALVLMLVMLPIMLTASEGSRDVSGAGLVVAEPGRLVSVLRESDPYSLSAATTMRYLLRASLDEAAQRAPGAGSLACDERLRIAQGYGRLHMWRAVDEQLALTEACDDMHGGAACGLLMGALRGKSLYWNENPEALVHLREVVAAFEAQGVVSGQVYADVAHDLACAILTHSPGDLIECEDVLEKAVRAYSGEGEAGELALSSSLIRGWAMVYSVGPEAAYQHYMERSGPLLVERRTVRLDHMLIVKQLGVALAHAGAMDLSYGVLTHGEKAYGEHEVDGARALIAWVRGENRDVAGVYSAALEHYLDAVRYWCVIAAARRDEHRGYYLGVAGGCDDVSDVSATVDGFRALVHAWPEREEIIRASAEVYAGALESAGLIEDAVAFREATLGTSGARVMR